VITSIDPKTGNLVIGGTHVFPLGLSDPPPVGSKTPSGNDGLHEVAAAGVTHLRYYKPWATAAATATAQVKAQVGKVVDGQITDALGYVNGASTYGLQVWMSLEGLAAGITENLDPVVNALKDRPGLGVWKGADEPAHSPIQNTVAGCSAVYKQVQTLDPDHPVVLIEAPRGPAPKPNPKKVFDTTLRVADVQPYAAACDIHGIDIYPVSSPLGKHAGTEVNTDISVVGDMTSLISQATPGKAIWMTLQIAWQGVLPTKTVNGKPTLTNNVLVFPDLGQTRFMAYDAIVHGARGLFFFGGHLPYKLSNAHDPKSLLPLDHGWNWNYWDSVQRPLLGELTEADHARALTAPIATNIAINTDTDDMALSPRVANGFLYLIAVRRTIPSAQPELVQFSGLPAGITDGVVLGHGPYQPGFPPRPFSVENGVFTDLVEYAPHNARVYRFELPAS
jgi:hypothetical protein